MLGLLLAMMVDAHAARGFLGLEWRPLSRQDLVWVEEGRTSGTAVGEFDGTVRPLLGAFGGAWFNRYVGLSFGLHVASLQQASRTEEAVRRATSTVLRPSVDVRLGWMEPRERFPVPWFLLGVYGDIPAVSDRSDAYSEAEQEAADSTSAEARYRLGGVGGRAGVGVDYRILPGLAVGAQVSVGLHRAGYTGGDARFATLWVATEAAFLVTFEWPGKAARAARAAAAPAGAPAAPDPAEDPSPGGVIEAAPAEG